MKYLSFLIISMLFFSCANQTETIEALEVKIDSLETVVANLEALPTIDDLEPVFISNSRNIKLGEELKGYFCLALIEDENPASVFNYAADDASPLHSKSTETDTVSYDPQQGLHIFQTVPSKKGVGVEHFKMIKKFGQEKKVYYLEIEYEVN